MQVVTDVDTATLKCWLWPVEPQPVKVGQSWAFRPTTNDQPVVRWADDKPDVASALMEDFAPVKLGEVVEFFSKKPIQTHEALGRLPCGHNRGYYYFFPSLIGSARHRCSYCDSLRCCRTVSRVKVMQRAWYLESAWVVQHGGTIDASGPVYDAEALEQMASEARKYPCPDWVWVAWLEGE